MKDVDGWVVGQNVYKKRWMQPTPGLAEMNSFVSPKLKNEDNQGVWFVGLGLGFSCGD